MGSSIILAGLGMAAVGFAGRHALRVMPQVSSPTFLQVSHQAIRCVVPQVSSLADKTRYATDLLITGYLGHG
jgi:hypothetical protein